MGNAPIQLADLRLYFIDSTRTIRGLLGIETVDTYVDTARSRLAATDSTGFFAIWRLAPGRYWMHARRIGFSPIEAFVTIDSLTVLHDFEMPPIPALLSKVEIRDLSSTSLARRLDRVGFLGRKKFHGGEGTFLMPTDWERSKPQTVRDILSRYGIFSADVDLLMDRMPLDYLDVRDYPAELIAAVEIYRHGRPAEFNGTSAGPTAFRSARIRPLVVIWTHIP